MARISNRIEKRERSFEQIGGGSRFYRRARFRPGKKVKTILNREELIDSTYIGPVLTGYNPISFWMATLS